MSPRHLRRWPNIKTALGQCICPGIFFMITSLSKFICVYACVRFRPTAQLCLFIYLFIHFLLFLLFFF